MVKLKNPIFAEIRDQEKTWKSAIKKIKELDNEILKIFNNHTNMYFIGCGSSYYAGMITKAIYNQMLKKKSFNIVSSDFLFSSEAYVKNNLAKDIFFMISRTGETFETLRALEIIRGKYKGYPVALTSLPDTTLAKLCNHSIALNDCEEESITATKSMTSTTFFLICLIYFLSGKKYSIDCIESHIEDYFKYFEKYSGRIKKIVDKEDIKKVIFLGAGQFYGAAKESELKVKEMSLTNSDSNMPLEYRHGHKAILDDQTLVVLFLSDAGFEYEIKTIKEFHKIGARSLIICDSKKSEIYPSMFDYLIDIDLHLDEKIKPLFYILFGQLIGYYQAMKKDINPSFPRNLDYVVTFD